MREAAFMTCLVLTMSLSGCFGSEEQSTVNEEDTLYPDIYSRHTLDWNWTDSYSYVLQPGPHAALEVQEATITVDTTGVWGGGPNSADVHLSYWLPSNTEVGEQVPVIAVVSPYFSYGQPGDESNPTNIVAAGR
ncbi:MAG: hypothetical protein DWB99_06080, partial [Candidatus Poseidoniales archaeon]